MPFISDFVIDFNNPIIYSAIEDLVGVQILTSALDTLGFTYELQPPTTIADFSSLDNLLGGRDMIIVGGPIVNPVAEGLQTNLQAVLSSIAITSLSFSLSQIGSPLDGTLVSDSAPELSITDGSGSVVLVRTQNELAGTVSDWAVILRLDGTTNSLLYIAGIRDFGTAAALFVLDWATKVGGSIVWPYTDAAQLTRWQNALSTSNSFFLRFNVPSSEALDLNSAAINEFIDFINEDSLDEAS